MYKYCIFLDIDGVLNHQIFYDKFITGDFSTEERRDNVCETSISFVNDLYDELGGAENCLIVCSSTWRFRHKEIKDLNPLFKRRGAKWEFFERTPNSNHGFRGLEIYDWLDNNCEKYFGCSHFDFKNYAIIDDDSDMLLWQRENFFQTDPYCGITPNIVYNIVKKFKACHSN